MSSYTHFVRTERPATSGPGGATTDAAAVGGTGESLVLEPLGAGQPMERFDRFTTERDARTASRDSGGELYRVRRETRGPWTHPPLYAVYAIWQLADPAQAAGFEQSRQELFECRRRVLPTFAVDWLLQAPDTPGRYLVLGLYGDEAGLRLARDHSEIRRVAQRHPPADYGASDLSGMRYFRVGSAGSPAASRTPRVTAEQPAAPVASLDGTLFRVELGSAGRPELIRWSTPVAPQIYDAYALITGGGPVLVDPQIESEGVWHQLVGMLGRRPVATVLTSSWHERSAYRLRDEHDIPVWLPAAGTDEMGGRPDYLFGQGDQLPGGIAAVTVDNGFAGDTVLRWLAARGERVLFSGDVILGQLNAEDARGDHWRRGPGVYLWLHGRGDHARFRTAFGPLLQEEFDLVCSAHSVVLRERPKARLAHLLDTGHVVERPMRRGAAVALVPPEPHAT